jgi:hypothetical protein
VLKGGSSGKKIKILDTKFWNKNKNKYFVAKITNYVFDIPQIEY